MSLPAFKAYDIRGRVPDELNEDLARRIGVALAGQLESGPVVVGAAAHRRGPGHPGH
jgi:phosphomannomutase/phosphoglucomutase